MTPLPATLAALLLTTAAATAEPVLPDFNPADFATGTANPYVPLVPGTRQVLSGTAVDGDATVPARLVRSVLGDGPVILGVQTIAVLDEEFEGGRVMEVTMDYYAPDKAGNIWYFGEDVTEYRYDAAGNLTEAVPGSSWHAGINGADPGILMQAKPEPGVSLFVGHAPAEGEMDYSELAATGEPLTVPAGTFPDVVKIYSASMADPDLREYRYWAKDVGLIRVEEDLSPALDTPAITVTLDP